MKILLDSNFLLLPAQLKIDIYEVLKEHELITLDLCVNEIEKLAKNKGRTGENARVALQLIKKKNMKISQVKKSTVDAAIIDYADKNNCYVATNDRKLIKKLKNRGIKIIRVRQKKVIMVD